ncbi:MAG: LysR family transcriptional regulator [bacterium]
MQIPTNFNHLFYFYIIAREGSIVKACRVLNLTQSTLSNQLRDFENSLGVKLFDRRYRKLVLNEHGKKTLEYANMIFSSANSMLSSLKSSDTMACTLNLGISSTLPGSFANRILHPLIASKEVKANVVEGDVVDLTKKLETFEIDFILSDSQVKMINQELGHQKIMESPLAIVTSEANSKEGAAESLNGCPFVLFSDRTNLRQKIDNYFVQNQIIPHISGEVDNTDFILRSVIRKDMYTVVPLNAIDEVYSSKIEIIEENIGEHAEGWIVYRKNDWPIHPVVEDMLSRI